MRLLTLFLLISIGAFAQNYKPLIFDENIGLKPIENIELPSDKLITDYSFSKLTLKDLSYLLLGDTSPSEGLEATFSEDKNKISLSGGIYSGLSNLLTIKGDFSSNDDGVYFFDENKGSTSAKISFNFFQSFRASRKYDKPVSISSKKVQRGFFKIEAVKRKMIANLLRDYHYAWALLENYGIPVEDLDTKIDDFKKDVLIYKYEIELEDDFEDKVDKTKLNTFITEKKLGSKKPPVVNSISIIEYDKKKPKTIIAAKDIPIKPITPKKIHTLKLDPFDIEKAITLYETTLSSMDSISDKIIETETKQAQPYWNSKRLPYFGISPFYERETIKNVYTFNESLPFDDQFKDAQGDLFGVDLQAGYFYQAKKESSTLTKISYTRITGQIARGSNISEFKKRTYDYASTTIDTLSTTIITTPNKTEGNYNKKGNAYNFGVKTSIGFETYWYPSMHYGLFGQIGYSHVEFDSGKGEDSEIYNLRLGILINLKAKEKNFATLQFFADRSDLSLSPNSKDENLRFGFKLGLPFNFESKL